MDVNNKLVYIGNSIDKIKKGGDIVNYRNLSVLSDLFKDNFVLYELRFSKNDFVKILKKLFLYPIELSPILIIKCIRVIKQIKPKWVFITTSQHGRLIKKIKKISSAKIITYFHNIEKYYAKEYLSIKMPNTILFYLMCCYNEKKTVRYSDVCICINNRDKTLLKEYYKRDCDSVIPVSLSDIFDVDLISRTKALLKKIDSKKALFVGSNFFGNTEGLSWFIENVLPYVNIKLLIVGTGMSKIFKNQEKIEVYDYVDDLSQFYLNADFVVSPIFSGGGMKTKIAEALMYGKSIIGTQEALEGYELKSSGKIFICQSKEDFIWTIENIYTKDIFYFNEDIRDIYLKYYSTENIKTRFFSLFV
jgi:hypothetical protein